MSPEPPHTRLNLDPRVVQAVPHKSLFSKGECCRSTRSSTNVSGFCCFCDDAASVTMQVEVLRFSCLNSRRSHGCTTNSPNTRALPHPLRIVHWSVASSGSTVVLFLLGILGMRLGAACGRIGFQLMGEQLHNQSKVTRHPDNVATHVTVVSPTITIASMTLVASKWTFLSKPICCLNRFDGYR